MYIYVYIYIYTRTPRALSRALHSISWPCGETYTYIYIYIYKYTYRYKMIAKEHPTLPKRAKEHPTGSPAEKNRCLMPKRSPIGCF